MSWWTNPAVKILRWLVFIPLAFLLLAIVGAAWSLAIVRVWDKVMNLDRFDLRQG